MVFILADRVRETTLTTGVGLLTLAGAMSDYQSFAAAIGDQNSCYYCVTLPDGDEWEVGIGTVTVLGNTLSRDTVLSSSNSGAAVNFSAGTKEVFVVHPAGRMLYQDDVGIARIGVGANYLEVLADGEIRLHGTARVYDDYKVYFETAYRSHPINPPRNDEDNFATIDFDDSTEEELFFKIHTPLDADPSRKMYFHLDFFVDNVDQAVERAVRWGIEYKIIQHGQVVDFDAGTFTSLKTHAIPITTVDKEMMACEDLVLSAANYPGEGILLFRLYRDVTNVADTHNGDARLFGIHLHYAKDRLGVAF